MLGGAEGTCSFSRCGKMGERKDEREGVDGN
jgi:hypothetical protein